MRIESVIVGTNADLIARAARLYIEPDDVVVDVTFGRGEFWRRTEGIHIISHDLDVDIGDGVDLRHLPEADDSVDVIVLDPPYRLRERGDQLPRAFADRYGLDDAHLTNPEELWDLYGAGILEVARVLRRRGRIFVKCQDFTEGRGFNTAILELGIRAREVGFHPIDIFVLHAGTGPSNADDDRAQHTARRAHSYLVVFARARSWRRRDGGIPSARGPERLGLFKELTP